MRVVCSDSIHHNWVQVLSIPVLLLDLKFCVDSRVQQQTPEEGQITYQLKREYNKDEDNSPKTLNDFKKFKK